MYIEDLRCSKEDLEINTNLCIVGSGPAGLSIALEFSNTGVQVLILESGGQDDDADIDELGQIESVGVPRVREPAKLRNRILGGTSHSWGGRCAAFDEIDFEVRHWIPFSGWPIRRADLIPYLDRAARRIGITPGYYGDRTWSDADMTKSNPDFDDTLLKPFFWQQSRDATAPRRSMHFGRNFLSSTTSNIRILLHATVTQICTNEDGSQFDVVEVADLEGRRAKIRANVLILCAGGIENARLLLSSNRTMKGGLGNQNDNVGRFLMDHPRSEIGEFTLENAHRILKHFRHLGRLGYHFERGVALSADIQRKMELMNCSAWPVERIAPDDAWNALKRLARGQSQNRMKDVWWCISQPGFLARGIYEHFLRGRGFYQKMQRLVLECDVEQVPDPQSRIRLSDRTDRLGQPLAQIDWRVSEKERLTVATLGKLIVQEFPRKGLPAPKLADWIESGRHDEARFSDVAHPSGSTRMSQNPSEGVVDDNCKIHGIEGIYISGSSIFPTNGHSNPTLMIVALAIRLADRLKATVFH